MVEPVREAIAEPMKTIPGTRRSIDWTARYRATTLEVQRYSRFVVVMKRALPMAAAALLAAVVAYSLQPRLPSGYLAYEYRIVPQFSGGSDVLVSYSLSTTGAGGNFGSISLYRPRFLDVKLPAIGGPSRAVTDPAP